MIKKNILYAFITDVVFIVLLLITLSSGRLILGSYLSQISQYNGLSQYSEVNADNIEEIENALTEIGPMINKALISQYLINFFLLLSYTLLIGTSWLLMRNKISFFKEIFKFKKYYLIFSIISLIYFYIIYKLFFKLIDLLNIFDYSEISLSSNELLSIFLILFVILILSFFYFIASIKAENLKKMFRNLKKQLLLKTALFLLLSLFIFIFLFIFFELFISYLTGFIGLLEWYYYVVLIISFLAVESLRLKLTKNLI